MPMPKPHRGRVHQATLARWLYRGEVFYCLCGTQLSGAREIPGTPVRTSYVVSVTPNDDSKPTSWVVETRNSTYTVIGWIVDPGRYEMADEQRARLG